VPEPTEVSAAYVLELDPVTVEPGTEGTICVDADGPTTDMAIAGWRAETAGSHHVNLFVRTSGTPFQTPTPCTNASSMGDMVFGVVGKHVDIELNGAPEYRDVRMTIPAAAHLIWEIHYLNTTSASLEAKAHVEFALASGAGRMINRFIFNGGKNMNIPAGVSRTLSFSCPGRDAETSVLYASSHSHSHNELVTLGFGGAEIYQSTDWESPAQAYFDSTRTGDLVVPAGTSASWSCTIRNTLSVPITFGNSVQKGEMCIASGFILGQPWNCSLP
jgi:hypothetical protein